MTRSSWVRWEGEWLYKKSWSHLGEHGHLHTDINIPWHFFSLHFFFRAWFAEQSRDNKNVRYQDEGQGGRPPVSIILCLTVYHDFLNLYTETGLTDWPSDNWVRQINCERWSLWAGSQRLLLLKTKKCAFLLACASLHYRSWSSRDETGSFLRPVPWLHPVEKEKKVQVAALLLPWAPRDTVVIVFIAAYSISPPFRGREFVGYSKARILFWWRQKTKVRAKNQKY